MPQSVHAVPLDDLPCAIEDWLVGRTISEVERSLIVHTLAHYNWNRTRAAKGLGISLRTMRNKLRDYKAQELLAARGLGSYPSCIVSKRRHYTNFRTPPASRMRCDENDQ